MTKCEQAQKGVDELLDKLETLSKEALTATELQKRMDKAISIQIRVTIVQVIRCIQHYANHMNGFKEALPPLPRITYREDQESLDLLEEEKASDDRRAEEELEVLGSIGFKNAKEPYFKYPEAIAKID